MTTVSYLSLPSGDTLIRTPLAINCSLFSGYLFQRTIKRTTERNPVIFFLFFSFFFENQRFVSWEEIYLQISDFRFRKDILLKDIFFSQTKEILKLISLLLTNNSLLVKECLKGKI